MVMLWGTRKTPCFRAHFALEDALETLPDPDFNPPGDGFFSTATIYNNESDREDRTERDACPPWREECQKETGRRYWVIELLGYFEGSGRRIRKDAKNGYSFMGLFV